MYYIYSFKSRTNAISFYDALKKEQINASLINTPRSVEIGCGLSVKTFDQQSANRVLSRGYPSFYSAFRVDNRGGETWMERI